MKILLVKARLSKFYGQTVPPLGLLYLSAVLKKQGFADTVVLHPDALGLDEAGLEKALADFAPDVVGISALTAEGASLHSIARQAKKLFPRSLVVAGGPYPTASAADCLAGGAVDAAVRGEGEETFLEIVRNFAAGRGPAGITGTVCQEGGRLVEGPPRVFIEDLDSLPFPDWDAVDLETYRNHIPQTPVLYGERYATLLTSRGCPYRCIFCHGVMGKRFRAHSPGRVLAELERLRARYAVERVEVADDTFNCDRERAAGILRALAAGPAGLKLYLCGIRTDLVDAEFAALMAAAGVVYAATGVETGSPRLQKKIGKDVDLGRFAEGAAHLVKNRIFVTAGFMLGFPGETFGEMLRTLRYAWSLPVHTVMTAFCRAYGGTALGDAVRAERVLDPASDTAPFYGAKAGRLCSDVPVWRVVLLKWLANTVFYLNPARIFRILRDLPDPSPRVLALLVSKMLERTFFLR